MSGSKLRLAVGVALLLLTAAGPVRAQTGGDAPPVQPIFLPNLVDFSAPAPTPALRAGERVYSLLGTIEPTSGRRYANYLVTQTGEIAGLAGETPEMETRIDELAAMRPSQPVKVWGVFNRAPDGWGEPWILVTGIIGAGPVPSPEPVGQPTAAVRFGLVTLRAGPAQSYQATGSVVYGQVCDITGRDVRRTWWQLECDDGAAGWIDGRLVEVTGSTILTPIVVPTPPLEPTPTPLASPSPTPPPPSAWRASLFDNAGLAGSPRAYASFDTIDFNWGTGTAHSALPTDRFSIRFEREFDFEPGYYQFQAQADDGVRVWIDDQLVVDEWHGAGGATYSVNRALQGRRVLRVEYYEAGGLASVRFDVRRYEQAPEWQATYYDGTVPSGSPALQRQEPRSTVPLDYDWSYGAPVSGSPGNDLWSARWRGQFEFSEGDYMFRAVADDGVRVYVDGLRVIDQWRDGYKDAQNRFIAIGEGKHLVEVEYYERTGRAMLRVWWYPLPATSGPS